MAVILLAERMVLLIPFGDYDCGLTGQIVTVMGRD
jgi:hypothetical protein